MVRIGPSHGLSGYRATLLFGFCAVCLSCGASAGSPEELLHRYEDQAKSESPDFRGFSIEQGREFYFRTYPIPILGEVGCVSCHLADPRRSVMRHRTRIPCRSCHVIDDAEHPDPVNAKKREIAPFAPVANPARFSDFELVEKWFAFNCSYLLKRNCTTLEKGGLLMWLLTWQPGEMDNKPELGKEYQFLLEE